MATYYSILAWRIPWTEEPGRLHPWNCKELDSTFICSCVCICIYIYIHIHVYTYTHTLIGEGNGTPLQYSCLENPMDGEV